MAKYVLKDAYIAINGTVVSNLANSCELEDSADEEADGVENPVGDAFRDLVEGKAGGAAEQSADAVDHDANRVGNVC